MSASSLGVEIDITGYAQRQVQARFFKRRGGERFRRFTLSSCVYFCLDRHASDNGIVIMCSVWVCVFFACNEHS